MWIYRPQDTLITATQNILPYNRQTMSLNLKYGFLIICFKADNTDISDCPILNVIILDSYFR